MAESTPSPAAGIMPTMSVANGLKPRPPYQPFQCLVCHSRFTRHENLKRHAALHTRSEYDTALRCEFCEATFSRLDLRHRHVKRKHPEHHEARPRKKSPRNLPSPSSQENECGSQPDNTTLRSAQQIRRGSDLPHWVGEGTQAEDGGFWQRVLHDRDDGQDQYGERHLVATSDVMDTKEEDVRMITTPLTPQTSRGESACIGHIVQEAPVLEPSLLLGTSVGDTSSGLDSFQMHRTTPQTTASNARLNSFSGDHGHQERSFSASRSPQAQIQWQPSRSQVSRGCDLFFTHVSPFVPFLHRPTFDARQIPSHLLLSILCLGYQYGEDPDCGNQPGSGASLSLHCFEHARGLIAHDDESSDDVAHNVSMVQTYLFLQIYAMMYACGKKSAQGLKTHSKMVSLARAAGLVQPIIAESGSTQDLDSLWHEFIVAESYKRTLFAVHQIDTLWYQFLSIPRLVSHLEIKHELPCPEDYWNAPSAAVWAHRQLAARNSGLAVQYPDAIRQVTTSTGDLGSIAAFDPYGAINITHFIMSSAQEISGWSTMTGMLSMERLELLRTSLVALGPFVRPSGDSVTPATGPAPSPSSSLCEATWESAMIDMQIWSPSHTGGIVEGSMDAVLRHMTFLAPSYEFLRASNVAETIQPHVDWFLRYLDSTESVAAGDSPGGTSTGSVTAISAEAPWVTLYAYKAFMIALQLVAGGMRGAMQVVGVPDGDAEAALAWARKVFRRRQRWQLGKIIMACLDTLRK
ncbi:fungal-specific transcription factor domain-containing protein [Xylariales sp. PMI_506]|nr:fungal-specific transcription factor domain-containing protein [Xylariales sp. PMI_506]